MNSSIEQGRGQDLSASYVCDTSNTAKGGLSDIISMAQGCHAGLQSSGQNRFQGIENDEADHNKPNSIHRVMA